MDIGFLPSVAVHNIKVVHHNVSHVKMTWIKCHFSCFLGKPNNPRETILKGTAVKTIGFVSLYDEGVNVLWCVTECCFDETLALCVQGVSLCDCNSETSFD